MDTILEGLRGLNRSTKSRDELLAVLLRLEILSAEGDELRFRLMREYEALADPLQRALLLLALGGGDRTTQDWIRSKVSDPDELVADFAVLALFRRQGEGITSVYQPGNPIEWHEALLLIGFAEMLAIRRPGYSHFCAGSCLGTMIPSDSVPSNITPCGPPIFETLALQQAFASQVRTEDWSVIAGVIEGGEGLPSRTLALKLLNASGQSSHFTATFLRMLLSNAPEDGNLALQGLGGSRTEEGARKLLDLASQESADSRLRSAALDNLDNTPYATVLGVGDTLRGFLHDDDPDIRINAARLLARIQDSDTTVALENALLSDPDPQVRRHALDSLVEWPGTEDAGVKGTLNQVVRENPESALGKMARTALSESK